MKTFDEACEVFCGKGEADAEVKRRETLSRYGDLAKEVASSLQFKSLLTSMVIYSQDDVLTIVQNVFVYGVLIGIEMEKPE